MIKKIFISDLDGTLLDSETYSFTHAQPALDALRSRDIPLVLCSSKTKEEIIRLRRRLRNSDPFVSENGGGIFTPRDYFSFSPEGTLMGEYLATTLGKPYAEIRSRFLSLRRERGTAARGFGDMTAEEIAALTGLTIEEAALARERDFTEPFYFDRGTDPAFLRAVEAAGLHWTQGRLHVIMGDHDKGKAVRMILKWYEREHGKIISIGLGDAGNDLPLLREVDHPVLVQMQNGDYDPAVSVPGLIRAPGIGPRGWNEAVLDLLRS